MSLKRLAAGIAVGSIVGIPLLYTMEMWFHGMTLGPWHLLSALGAILALNIAFCAVSGFADENGPWATLRQAVIAVGMGLVFSLFILLILGVINPGDLIPGGGAAMGPIAGMLLLEAGAVSLGISFANVHTGGDSRTGDTESEAKSDEEAEHLQRKEDLRDLAATLAGSMLFALNIAPTEEVILIAGQITPWHLLGLLGTSLILCYVILYGSGFEKQPVHVKSLLQHPWSEALMATAVSIVVAAGLLWMLGETQTTGSFPSFVASVVVLGLPATVGGAAGRLAI